MTFDWQAHMRETARHLLAMAKAPGWDAHARFRRDEFLADPLYAGLREILVEMRHESASLSPSEQAPGSTAGSTTSRGSAA